MIVHVNVISIIMSQFISKRISLNNPSTHNQTTLFLLALPAHQIAAVQTHAIIIYNTLTQQQIRTIDLPFELCQIVYNIQHQQFIMLPKCQDLATCQIYTLSYSQTPTLKSYYHYQDNKIGAKQFEWQSWLKTFQLSQTLVLIRKFYGYSLCVVFDVTPQLVKRNEFRINEQCISKLDEQRYLVNYRQIITRYSLVVEIVNVDTNKKQEYKITEQIVPNTTKSVKLWKKEKESTNKGEHTTLTLLIAMNTKFDGYALMIVKVLQQSNNYMVMGVIYQNKYEIYKIFPINYQSQEFITLEYRYEEKSAKMDFVLCNYQLDQKKNLFNETYSKVIEGSFQGICYSHRDKQLVLYENGLSSGKQSNLLLNMLRVVEKQVVYASLLDGMNCRAISQQILDLLT